MITTIACPLDLTHPEVNPETAPVWTDGTTEYRVASGVIDAGVDLDPRILVATGVDGITALTEMGLTPAEEVENG